MGEEKHEVVELHIVLGRAFFECSELLFKDKVELLELFPIQVWVSLDTILQVLQVLLQGLILVPLFFGNLPVRKRLALCDLSALSPAFG